MIYCSFHYLAKLDACWRWAHWARWHYLLDLHDNLNKPSSLFHHTLVLSDFSPTPNDETFIDAIQNLWRFFYPSSNGPHRIHIWYTTTLSSVRSRVLLTQALGEANQYEPALYEIMNWSPYAGKVWTGISLPWEHPPSKLSLPLFLHCFLIFKRELELNSVYWLPSNQPPPPPTKKNNNKKSTYSTSRSDDPTSTFSGPKFLYPKVFRLTER